MSSRQFAFWMSLTTLLAYGIKARSDAYEAEASITGLYTGPYFDPLAPRNITAHQGDRALLPCVVRQLGDKSVSWLRKRDQDILTVDRYTFVADGRFESQYSVAAETWNLIINYVQGRDAGDYECQVSTEPKMSQIFNLRVVVPKVNIKPTGDLHVKAGSRVRIDCHITDVVKIPDYIFWNHEDSRVLDSVDENIDIKVERTGEESLKSTLLIERVRKGQGGNYTCMPSNLHAANTLLHVLTAEEHPAAMQDGRNSTLPQLHSQGLLLLLLVLLLYVHQDAERVCGGSAIRVTTKLAFLATSRPGVVETRGSGLMGTQRLGFVETVRASCPETKRAGNDQAMAATETGSDNHETVQSSIAVGGYHHLDNNKENEIGNPDGILTLSRKQTRCGEAPSNMLVGQWTNTYNKIECFMKYHLDGEHVL